MRNLDIAVQLIRKGSVLLVPVAPSYKILGESQSDTTYIDCMNRISLKEEQIKKCRHISYLPDEILVLVDNAKKIADLYERSV